MQFGCYFKTNETFFSEENVKDLGLAEFLLSHSLILKWFFAFCLNKKYIR